MSHKQRVAIVGGGLAGIAAATVLAQQNFQVVLYESKRRLGGRVGSFIDPASGQELDYCQHVGMACCTNLTDLLARLDLSQHWKLEDTLHFYDTRGRHLPLRAWPLPAPLHLSGLLLRWPELSWLDRLRIATALNQLMRMSETDSRLNALAITWLHSAKQSDNAIENFWRTILVSALGEDVEKVALKPARKVLLDGFAVNRSAYKLLVPQKSLSKLFDLDARRRLTELSVDIRIGRTIDAVVRNSDGTFSLETNRHVEPTYNSLILAVPWYRVTSLLPNDHGLDQITDPGQLQHSPITGIHTWWDQPWMDQPHAILVKRMCQWIFPKERADRASNENYYQIVISSSRDFKLRDANEIAAAIKQDLKDIFPGIHKAKLLSVKVVTDPKSVFSLTPDSFPKRLKTNHFAAQNLWLAGDWTDTDWPATMEGAVHSGYSAAAALASKVGVDVKLPVADLPRGNLIPKVR